MEWRNIKVRVSSPEMSRAFQEEAFKNGCSWIDMFTKSKEEDKEFLFINEDGHITWHDEQLYYDNDQSDEVVVALITTYKFSLNKEDTIEFNGRTYNKVKFLNAIKGLEQ